MWLNNQLFKNSTQGNIYIFVFLASIFLGICSGLIYYNESPVGDAAYYYNTANLIKDNFSTLFNSPKIGVAESLNAIIQGLIFRLPGNDFLSVYFLQILIYGLTGLFIFKVAEKFTGRSWALLVLVFYLINHNNWVHIYNFKPGVWVNFFLILTVYYVYLVFQKPEKRKNYILTGVFSALLLLTDLRYLPHILFIYFMLLFDYTNISYKLKNITFSALIMILLISPWIVRQYLVFDRFILISDVHTLTIQGIFNTESFKSLSNYTGSLAHLSEDEFNDQFWDLQKNLKLTPGELIYARGAAKKTILNAQNVEVSEKYSDLINKKVFTEEQISSIIQREEKRPVWIQRLKLAVYFWEPFKLNYTYNPLSTYKTFLPPASLFNNLNRILTLGILLPFLFLGLFFLLKKRNLFGITLAGIFAIHTLVHVLTYVQWRYLLPVLPLITIAAIYGARSAYYNFIKRNHQIIY